MRFLSLSLSLSLSRRRKGNGETRGEASVAKEGLPLFSLSRAGFGSRILIRNFTRARAHPMPRSSKETEEDTRPTKNKKKKKRKRNNAASAPCLIVAEISFAEIATRLEKRRRVGFFLLALRMFCRYECTLLRSNYI